MKPLCVIVRAKSEFHKAGWVHGGAVFAHFKMQFHARAGIAVAHFGDLLTAFHTLTFFHEQVGFVVSVGGQINIIVLNNHEVTITTQTRATVHHLTISRRHHRLTAHATDVHAVVAITKRLNDFAFGGGLPACHWGGGSDGGIHGLGGLFGCGGGRGCCCGGCAGGAACGLHAQGLTQMNGVIRTDVVPCTQIVLADAVAFGNVVNGVAVLHQMDV